MAYDERLAGRVRQLLRDRTDVTERHMFGGLTFTVGGHMCCGINSDELILRLGPEAEETALTAPHARPMDFTRRPMPGFVTIAPDGLKGRSLSDPANLTVATGPHLRLCFEFARQRRSVAGCS